MNPKENSHDSLVERALVGFDLAAEHHLANCSPCEEERERVQEVLRKFGKASRQLASRPETFWEMQAARIRAARGDAGQRPRLTMALVASVAVLVLLAFASLSKVPKDAPVASTAPMVQTDADHELLLAVERAVDCDTPVALAPVTLMVGEDGGGLPLNATSEKKETGNHEN